MAGSEDGSVSTGAAKPLIGGSEQPQCSVTCKEVPFIGTGGVSLLWFINSMSSLLGKTVYDFGLSANTNGASALAAAAVFSASSYMLYRSYIKQTTVREQHGTPEQLGGSDEATGDGHDVKPPTDGRVTLSLRPDEAEALRKQALAQQQQQQQQQPRRFESSRSGSPTTVV